MWRRADNERDARPSLFVLHHMSVCITHVNTSYDAEDEMVIVIMMLRVEARR